MERSKVFISAFVSVVLIALLMTGWRYCRHELTRTTAGRNAPQPSPSVSAPPDNRTQVAKKRGAGAQIDEIALPNQHDVADMMDMQWNSWQVDVVFNEGRQAIDTHLRRIPLAGGALDNISKDRLYTMLDEILFAFGNEKQALYFDYLKQSHETVSPEMASAMRQILITQGNVPETHVEKDPWKLLVQAIDVTKAKSHWRGLVEHGSRIDIYETMTADIKPIGTGMHAIKESMATYPHSMNIPPVKFSDALKNKGRVRVADATVFINHGEELGGINRPYIIRLWYDEQSQLWRPMIMAAFPNPKERIQANVMF